MLHAFQDVHTIDKYYKKLVVLLFILIAIVGILISIGILSSRSPTPRSLKRSYLNAPYSNAQQNNKIINNSLKNRSIGKEANGAFTLEPVVIKSVPFVYKINVTNAGCLRLAVDYTFRLEERVEGSIKLFTGDVKEPITFYDTIENIKGGATFSSGSTAGVFTQIAPFTSPAITLGTTLTFKLLPATISDSGSAIAVVTVVNSGGTTFNITWTTAPKAAIPSSTSGMTISGVPNGSVFSPNLSQAPETAGSYSGLSNTTYTNVPLKYFNPLLPNQNGTGATASITVENNTVKKVVLTAGGASYRVNQELTPCFILSTQSNTNQGCLAATTASKIRIAEITKLSSTSPSLFDSEWLPRTTVRDIGPGAVYKANETQYDNTGTNPTSVILNHLGTIYSGNKYYDGICEDRISSTDPTKAQTKWHCLMDEYGSVLSGDVRESLLFETCTILAKTTESPADFMVRHLVHTYKGLGILAVPKGAEISRDCFSIGFNPLFSEMGHPRCGQTQPQLSLPSLTNYPITNYPCGKQCSNIIIPQVAQPYVNILWELASPNGLFRAQFFESGHFRFVKYVAAPITAVKIIQLGVNYALGTSATPLSSTVSPVGGSGATFTVTSIASIGATNSSITTNATNLVLVNAGTGYKIGDLITVTGGGTLKCILEVTSTSGLVDPPIFETAELNCSGSSTTFELCPSINTTFPSCFTNYSSAKVVPTKNLESYRDYWIIRGLSFTLEKDNMYTSIPAIDMMIQITDSGSLVLQKNYIYGVEGSHVITQAKVGNSSALEPLIYYNGGSIVGNKKEGDRNRHFVFGNILLCYGMAVNATKTFERNNGVTIAETKPKLINGVNMKYVLWFGNLGLRLLYVTAGTGVTDEILTKDFTKSLWITPLYKNWFLVNGDSWKYTDSQYCRSNGQPNSIDPTDSTGGYTLHSTFRVPISESGEYTICALRSKNCRYLFYMRSSGRCELIDFNTYPSNDGILWTTDRVCNRNWNISNSCV